MLPQQEVGVRLARAVPYALSVDDRHDIDNNLVWLDFTNTGKAGAVFQVYAGGTSDGPKTYTVEAGKKLSDAWPLVVDGGIYDLSVYAPNGFLRQFKGAMSIAAIRQEPVMRAHAIRCDIFLTVKNSGRSAVKITVIDNAYGSKPRLLTIAGGASVKERWSLASSNQWYDLSIGMDADNNFARFFLAILKQERTQLPIRRLIVFDRN